MTLTVANAGPTARVLADVLGFRRVADELEQRAWRLRVAQGGLQVTPVVDRFYFTSICFREPGGVLFEIATDGPGFTADEDAATLGERLSLPPFLEPRRAQIEAGLTPLPPARRSRQDAPADRPVRDGREPATT